MTERAPAPALGLAPGPCSFVETGHFAETGPQDTPFRRNPLSRRRWGRGREAADTEREGR
jgi:hypothetical protein